MKLSHSKMQTALINPMDYYLNYEVGIKLKETKPYFMVGSAVHWGLEHNTYDLDDYFKENGTNYEAQFQAEAMAYGYLIKKDRILNEILKDYVTGEKLPLLDDDCEYHELELEVPLKSFRFKENHLFLGIIDLLFLTPKGFILCDYKTSSSIPDFEHYLSQLYKYIFLLKSYFPTIPIYKIAIINIIKSNLKRFKNESEFDFRQRFKKQYEDEDSKLINIHIFNPNKIIKDDEYNNYVYNLSKQADIVQSIVENKIYYINEAGAKNPYPSIYLDIYNKVDKCFMEYTIKDIYYNEVTQKIESKRDCIELDMKVIDYDNVLNKYELYKELASKYKDKKELKDYIKSNYLYDDKLLINYDYIYSNNLA